MTSWTTTQVDMGKLTTEFLGFEMDNPWCVASAGAWLAGWR